MEHREPRHAWHASDADRALKALETGEDGISPEEAAERLRQHGPNVLEAQETVSPLRLLVKQVANPLVYLLVGAAAVSLVADHLVDAIVIAIVIVLNTALGFFQEFRAERALESLREMTSPKARVLRDGRVSTIDAADLVPGDILLLETGDRVAADGRLIACDDLEIDESVLTGESEGVHKQTGEVPEDAALGDRTNMVFLSTSVTGGRGRAVVAATGMDTQLGKIAAQVQATTDDQTPLQKRIAKLGVMLGIAGIGFAGVIFGIGMLTGYELFEMALFAIAVAVSAIPEGLPAVISVTLALGVQRMARRKAIIRSLPAVETLGSTTVICSDKTGTITRNEMTVTHVYAGGRRWRITGEGYSTEGTIEPADEAEPDDADSRERDDAASRAALEALLETGFLANNARLPDDEGAALEGSPTEKAILACSAKGLAGIPDSLRSRKRLSEIPFSSTTKYMAVLAESDGATRAHVKGAPERVLGFCSHVLLDGERRPLDEDERKRIAAEADRMAGGALRVIAGAVRDLPEDRREIEAADAEEGLTFAGLWGMIDPPREDAVQAIGEARSAGIHTVMITGDHARTASAIAHQAGIAPEGREAVTGSELDSMDDPAIVEAAFERAVFARVSPAHKLQILRALRAHGEIVAMTGDGVNDAPALKGADIGVAMGITGTEVAKGASDMVLLDDNYATIVHAVEEGRVVFANLRRVIFFLLATNLGEILTLAAGLVLGLPLPLTAIMVLWINLVTDGACTIPLGVEPKHRDVLKTPPRRPGEFVLTGPLIGRMAVLSAVMAAGTTLLYVYELGATTVEAARTIAFTTLAAFQWFQAFNARSTRESVFSVGILTNRWVLVGVAAAVVMQLLAVYTPVGQLVFGTVALRAIDWLLIVAVTSTIWAVDEVMKLIRRIRRR